MSSIAHWHPLPAPGTAARFVVDVLDGAACRALADVTLRNLPFQCAAPATRYIMWLIDCERWHGVES